MPSSSATTPTPPGVPTISLPDVRVKKLGQHCDWISSDYIHYSLLKAGNVYKFQMKKSSCRMVHGVAMNPIEHPPGGGNHQHIGDASTVRSDSLPGHKVGHIAVRRTGRLRG
ncbi:hypothetical protein MLD38_031170 [Melastoma candidum]|uniref:Uncharacterized protein n=1 Tax=Melastoma candidum TaxID=119954 RepID=A0ACB9MQT9_9MYRT|nr:hypothetical protein MLD38_031170 [Melastoma candidum]